MKATQPLVDWRHPDTSTSSTIEDHALAAFYTNGYHGTSVRDIAARVGVTVPALYYHYENKEAILAALLDTSIERLSAYCAEALAEAGPSVELRFLHLVECIVRYMANARELAYLSAEYRSLSPRAREAYSGKRQRIEELMHDAILQATRAGAFDVAFPREAARALLGMIQAVATWYRPEGQLALEDLVARYLDLAVHTVGASEALVERVRDVNGSDVELS